MVEIVREIKKIGNGFYISVPASFIKENILKQELKYKISIKGADLNKSGNENNSNEDYSNFI